MTTDNTQKPATQPYFKPTEVAKAVTPQTSEMLKSLATPPPKEVESVDGGLLSSLETLIAWAKQSPLPPIMYPTVEEAIVLLSQLRTARDEHKLVEFGKHK